MRTKEEIQKVCENLFVMAKGLEKSGVKNDADAIFMAISALFWSAGLMTPGAVTFERIVRKSAIYSEKESSK